MNTIIIGDGLSRAVLDPDQPFRDLPRNVGPAEIDRLMGRGRMYGDGPLPAFLRAAVDAADAGAPIRLLLFGESVKTSGEEEHLPATASSFAEPLEEIARRCMRIETDPDSLPWAELQRLLGKEGADAAPSSAEETRYLVVGCHTEHRILALASFLRLVLGARRVAVASHLVGSGTSAAHFAALRHQFPAAGIEVLLDLGSVAGFAGLPAARGAFDGFRPCALELPADSAPLDAEQKRIVELLCLHWSRASLRPLGGGHSGSLLFLADGWKGSARTEPAVLKIDRMTQMRRELEGYHLVKDFFGKHVPTFGYPVLLENRIGVGMELAAMEGKPGTLQESFELADTEEAVSLFLRRLEKALLLLSEKLYRNTGETARIVPYRVFGVHTQKQQDWLVQNSAFFLRYLEGSLPKEGIPDPERLRKLLRLVSANEDGVDTRYCLSHGDMNLANIICDDSDNIWFIDWTHSGYAPVELDFAKLENDVKFVVSKDFTAEDLPRMRLLEEYLVAQRLPAPPNSLPEHLRFVRWDLRFRKILLAVRKIREACFALLEGEDWLVYRTALLRYALHNLSFDRRRGRGECEPPQLMFALYSVEQLLMDLVADDYHLKIRAERPASYPPRLRISIDASPWILECPEYDPPYHVDGSVLEQDRTRRPGGWADPEDFAAVAQEPRTRDAQFHDEAGRPLNPRGRTGIAGRGLLGLWGPNCAVALILLRSGAVEGSRKILLGNREGDPQLELPKGFLLPGEEIASAARRILALETGWRPAALEYETVFEGYTYDPRQTDHAWVESRALFLSCGEDVRSADLQPGGDFAEVRWWPFDAETINRIETGQARFIRHAVQRLGETGRMERADADKLLAATG